jgi:hypothetical protein
MTREQLLQSTLKGEYESMLAQFSTFKEQRPEQMDIYISKFNAQSMKVIYTRYLAYIRYLIFRATKDTRDYHERFSKHLEIVTDQKHLRDVFALYVMSFDDRNLKFDRDEGAYFREFKKAYYQLMTERQWLEETIAVENTHVECLSLILVLAHRIKSDSWMVNNPIEMRKNDHGVENDVP